MPINAKKTHMERGEYMRRLVESKNLLYGMCVRMI